MSIAKEMENGQGLSVVLGATGAIGSAVIFELAKEKKKVRAVVRNEEKAKKLFKNLELEIVKADVMNEKELEKAVKGAKIIYHCLNADYTKWKEMLPKINTSVIRAAEKSKARLAYADNLYMYKQSKPMTEKHPLNATSKKGKIRIKMAEEILVNHEKGKIKAVIARFSDFYGPNVTNKFAGPLFENPLDNKAASWIADLEQVHSMTFINDAARGLIVVAEDQESYGQVWHIPADRPVTGKEFITMIFEEHGSKPKIKVLGKKMLTLLSFIPIVRELKEMQYEWDRPFIIDGSKFETMYGFEVTSHKEAIKTTLNWFREEKENKE
ncbi:MAG: SDR family NAD(P)-dependent oxidoreductase [Candidatus Kariarchaeaceae archaeon]